MKNMTAAIYLVGREDRTYSDVRIILHEADRFHSERLDRNRRYDKTTLCVGTASESSPIEAVYSVIRRWEGVVVEILGSTIAGRLREQAEELVREVETEPDAA